MLIQSLLCLFLTHATPNEMLSKADAFRSPAGGFETRVKVKDADGSEYEYMVFLEGNEKSLIVTKAPAREIGRNTLMLDRDMWTFMPSINRPVRIALKQRLVGQVAQGDISRMKWVGDYTAEKLPSTDKGRIQLLLKAAKENLTYDRILLTLDSKDYRPLSAELQTVNGKPLKTITYSDYGPMGGATRPRLMKLQDAIKTKDVSEIRILEMKSRTFPTGFFSQANLNQR